MFGLFPKKKKNEEDAQAIIGSAIITDKTVQQMTAQADIAFKKPEYNPQTRKKYYDDGAAHKAAKDRAFSGDEPPKDPYTGADLVLTIEEAKIRYGKHWQEHLAEADHIEPLNQIVKRARKKPFVTTNDVKEIANSPDNYQVMSRELNQSGGKGGSTQKEWSQDEQKMGQLAEQTGESAKAIAEKIRKIGEEAEKRNSTKLAKVGVKNAVTTAHCAGKVTAINSGGTAATISGISNVAMCIKGEKTASDALQDVVQDSTKALASGYLSGAGLTVINHTLSCSSSKFIQALGTNNVAGKAITAISVTGDTVVKWGNGEISTEECLIELGDKGSNFGGACLGATIGQTLIPIPIVGGAVGSLVGGALTGNVYNAIVHKIESVKEEERQRMQEMYEAMMRYYAEQKRRQEVQQLIKTETENAVMDSIQTIITSSEFQRLIIEVGSYLKNHVESEQLIAEYILVSLQLQEYRKQLQEYIDNYFADYKEGFESALNFMDSSLELGDYDGAIDGINEVSRMFGKEPVIESTDNFKKKIFGDEKILL